MFTLKSTYEEVSNDYPNILDKWLSFIKNSNKEIDHDEIEFYYSYGFFVPKGIDIEYYEKTFEKCSKMLYNERLDFELSKVRVNLTLKLGQFLISDRMEKGFVPKIIKDIVTEVTKVKMIVESEYHDNIEVSDSIPDVDNTIVSFEIIKDVVDTDYNKSKDLDIDSILDKISKKGMDSLLDEEKEFLNRKSKDI